MIYLDANATTRVHPSVLEAMLPALTEVYGNPSSTHSAGQRARGLLDGAREQCAAALGVHPREIIFTSGGTEADALGLHGPLSAARAARPGLYARVVTTNVEHPAIREACAQLERSGVEIARVPVDGAGALDLDALEAELKKPGTQLCSAMAANNETGVLFPIPEIAARCRKHGVLLHVDAVQAAGKLPLALNEAGADLVSLSAHKIEGPKGAGLLWVRSGVPLRARHAGGAQERGRRGGTENVAGLLGLGAALERAARRTASEAQRLEALRDELQRSLEKIPGAHVVGAASPRLCNTLLVCFAGCDADTLLVALDLAGIAASTGSACSSGSIEPSPVLLAMGLAPDLARSAVRFSLWSQTTREEIFEVARLVPGIVGRVRAGA